MHDHGKVAFLCQIFPWVTQVFTFNEIEGLRANGIPLVVMAFKKPSRDVRAGFTPEMMASLDETIYIPFPLSFQGLWLQLRGFLSHPLRYLRLFWKVLNGKFFHFSSPVLRIHAVQDFLRGICIGVLLRNNNFRHIHAEFGDHASTSAWVAHKYSGIPFSFRSHATFNPQLIQNKLSDASFVLCVSEFERRRLIAWGQMKKDERIFLEYLGVDTERWRPEVQPEASLEKGLVLSVGTLVELKGHEYLIRACRILKDDGVQFRTLIIGEGPECSRLETLIERLDLLQEIEMRRYCDNDEVRSLMRRSSIFCLPSVVTKNGDADGIPVVLMEAMALEKACVSTRVAGIPELILDGVNGLLVEPRDSLALAQALRSLLEEPVLRKELGEAARSQILQNFSLKKNAARSAIYFQDSP